MPVDRELLDSVRAALRARSDAERAVGQQRYMKSALPFLGLTAPVLRAALRPVLADHRLTDRRDWEDTVRSLWDEATHREHWYAAIALARHRHYRAWRDSDAIPLWRHLIETGAWWDVVDEVATHLVQDALLGNLEVEGLRLRQWASDRHLWVRRAAVISQVGLRERLDPDLLTDVVEPNLADRDFFIRKAIGWALRDHARTDPAFVRRFVDAHAGELSGLSRREALKHLEVAS